MYTYSRLKGKQTNGGGSGWSIEGRQKYDELFMAVKTDRKKHAKEFNPQLLLFYQARRRREQQAKHNAKDDARPKPKAAYHRMNELAEDSDDEDEEGRYENGGFNDDDDNPTDGNNDNYHSQMNVFAMWSPQRCGYSTICIDRCPVKCLLNQQKIID